MGLDINDIISFTASVLYAIRKYSISIDKAFQRVKAKWGFKESYKVYYDVVKDVLRKYHQLKYLAKRILGSESNKAIVRLWVVLYGPQYFKRRDIVERFARRLLKKRGLRKIEDVWALIESLRGNTAEYLAVKHSYPREFVEELLRVLGPSQVEALLESMNKDHYWLRVNTLKIDVDRALRNLEREGVKAEVDSEIPFVLRVVESKRPLHHVESVKRGEVVIQDKASVISVLALSPEPGEVILDMCAAPGMKTSLIMQLTENKARVIAIDISRSRIASMRRMLKALGVDLSKIDILNADSRLMRVKGRIDKALIDAPCSSSGAIPKDPAVKISLERLGKVEWYRNVQLGLLKNAVSQFKGIDIVYVTCSLLPAEGEEVVNSIREDVKFVKPELNYENLYKSYDISRFTLRTYTHRDYCESFFIARLIPI